MTNDNRPTAEAMTISYIKSRFFRTVFAEGAYGGISPRGNIRFVLYNERGAIPQQSEATIDQSGKLIETVTQSRGGFVREVEVEVVMGIDEALELSRWLADKVDLAHKLIAGEIPDA